MFTSCLDGFGEVGLHSLVAWILLIRRSYRCKLAAVVYFTNR